MRDIQAFSKKREKMASRANSGPLRIGKIIGSVLKKAIGDSSPPRPEAVAVVACWPEIVGERLAKVSRAVSLRDGKLFVEVVSPVWKHELLMAKKNIIRRINHQMEENLVADMVYNVRDYLDVKR